MADYQLRAIEYLPAAICLSCGAVVSEDNEDLHDRFHAKLDHKQDVAPFFDDGVGREVEGK